MTCKIRKIDKSQIKTKNAGRSGIKPQNTPFALDELPVWTPRIKALNGHSARIHGKIQMHRRMALKRRVTKCIECIGNKTTIQRSIIIATTA